MQLLLNGLKLKRKKPSIRFEVYEKIILFKWMLASKDKDII